jgi:hypothetical protein
VVICFNTALSALHNATQWRLALQLLRRFDEEQLTPTVHRLGFRLGTKNKVGKPGEVIMGNVDVVFL